MSFAIVGAVVAGGAGLVGAVGGAALGLAGAVGGAALGTAGAVGSLGVGAASGLVSGIGSLFAPAAGVTIGESMAAIAQPAFYETAGAGVLGGIIPAAATTIGYLGEIAPAAAGIYSLIKPPQTADIPLAPSRAPLPVVSAPGIAKAPLPIFSQSPQVMTVGGPAKTAGPNYMIYIALAVVAYFLLRRK